MHQLQQQNILSSQMNNSHFDYDLYLLSVVLDDFEQMLADFNLPISVHN